MVLNIKRISPRPQDIENASIRKNYQLSCENYLIELDGKEIGIFSFYVTDTSSSIIPSIITSDSLNPLNVGIIYIIPEIRNQQEFSMVVEKIEEIAIQKGKNEIILDSEFVNMFDALEKESDPVKVIEYSTNEVKEYKSLLKLNGFSPKEEGHDVIYSKNINSLNK